MKQPKLAQAVGIPGKATAGLTLSLELHRFPAVSAKVHKKVSIENLGNLSKKTHSVDQSC